jgi:hypothetical protein
MLSLFGGAKAQREEDRRARRYRDLIHKEAVVGGQLFGTVPKGGRREFFCLDKHTWVWHEEWVDERGQRQVITTRYDVRRHGIFKAQDGQPYRPLTEEEAMHLFKAVNMYFEAVSATVYPQTAYLNGLAAA